MTESDTTLRDLLKQGLNEVEQGRAPGFDAVWAAAEARAARRRWRKPSSRDLRQAFRASLSTVSVNIVDRMSGAFLASAPATGPSSVRTNVAPNAAMSSPGTVGIKRKSPRRKIDGGFAFSGACADRFTSLRERSCGFSPAVSSRQDAGLRGRHRRTRRRSRTSRDPV